MQTISIAHSPDSDDAFMFYALANEKIDTGDLRFTHTLLDIESLNHFAVEQRYDITALSFHAYCYRSAEYAMLPCGASFGEDYGPKVVARAPLTREELAAVTVAIPGTLTTAALALRLYQPAVQTVVYPFDTIMAAVAAGDVDAGVIIHEGQLTYAREQLHEVLDLGIWWKADTGLPLPLGCNAIRRALLREIQQRAARYLRESIDYALAHRAEALKYAMQFSRGLLPGDADTFVGMYVNEVTREYGDRGRAAVQTLFDRAYQESIIPAPVQAEFVEWNA